MKKYFKGLMLTLLISAVATGSAENSIIWEHLGNNKNAEGEVYNTQRFSIVADQPFDGVAFCIVARQMWPAEPEDKLVEILPGYYKIESPRFKNTQPGDTVIVDLVTRGMLRNKFLAPDGIHLIVDDLPMTANIEMKSMIERPEQWYDFGKNFDFMPYGNQAYITNDSLRSSYRATPYGQIPTLKNVKLQDKKVSANKLLSGDFFVEKIDDSRFDYWNASIEDGKVKITTNSLHPQVIIDQLRRRIKESADANGEVPLATIEDWADYGLRAFMFDVGRNFLPKEDVKKLLDYMSRYGLNVLHFHLGEDEGWRLEIPSLPELTEIGGKRGYTMTDDVPFLKGIYCGDGNPYSGTTPNGYYTVDDYIDILKYADSKGIAVIPEFDTPGHSRAAIRAMEWRAKMTGDSTLRLIHDGDTSKYTTAQAFHDNTMNPALDAPYEFWSIVMDDIIKMYDKAGVPLLAINIGGDEVAEGVWAGSDKAQALMKQENMTDQRDLHAYFVNKLAGIAAEKGVKIAGWEEIALDHSPEYDSVVAPVVKYVNSWTYSDDGKGASIAKKGYGIVMSNVDYLYFDQNYTDHPDEPGLTWGGRIPETKPLHATADVLVSNDPDVQSNVIGISAHLWGETLRNFDMVQWYLFPRILALSERAHNGKETISEEEYFGLITEEMPRWDVENIKFYVRQPGIIIKDGMVYMNDAYGLGEIRYTLDGSEPMSDSALYTGPFAANNLKQLRAKLFIGNSASNTSILNPE